MTTNRIPPADRSGSSGVDAQNPWPGLVAFSEDLQAYFHGRDDEAEELLRRVDRWPLTVLFGQSGLGKSSLLQAGLFPRLRAAGYLPVTIRLDHDADAPSLTEQVIATVSRALVDAGGTCEASTEPGESLWEFFHRRTLQLRMPSGEPARPVLVFDQFEELFSIGQVNDAARERAAHFVDELADFVENRAPESLERRLDDQPELARAFLFGDRGDRVLISLREDYLPALESLRSSMPSIAENRMRLTRMNGERALDAVTRPGGSLIPAEVAREVVRFVAGGRRDGPELARLEVEPSLLSLVCRELNNRRLALGLPQITADLLEGSRERILQDFYDRCLADQPPALRVFVEDELVTDSGLRENLALERVIKRLVLDGVNPTAIDELVQRRLIHIEDRLDIQRVELTHDILTSVVKKSRDERRQREAAAEVERRAALSQEKSRRQRTRFRAIVGGLTVALGVVSAFGLWSYRLYQLSQERLREVQLQRQEALRQRDRAEKSEADAGRARKAAEVVKDVFDDATTPVTFLKVRHMPGLSSVEEKLASLRLQSLQRLAEKFPDDSSIPPRIAEAHALLGLIRMHVGSFRGAEEELHKALDQYRRLTQLEPGVPAHRLGEARVLNSLGFLFWDDSRSAAARDWYTKARALLEKSVIDHPDDPEFAQELGLCLIRLGGCLPVGTTPAERVAIAEQATGIFQRLIAQKHRLADARMGLVVARYRIFMAQADINKPEIDLKKLDEIDALDRQAIQELPDSPYAQSLPVFTQHDRADLLVQLGRFDEARAARMDAVARARATAEKSPQVLRNASILADSLEKLATDLRRTRQRAEARAVFEECLQRTDDLVQRYPDRAMQASEWVDARNQFSMYLGSSDGSNGGTEAAQDRVRTLDQTIERGRVLADRFPDHHWLQVNFAETLNKRGSLAATAQRKAEAFRDFNEGIEVYRTRILPDQAESRPDDLKAYLNLIQLACGETQAGERIRLAQLALAQRDRIRDVEPKQSLAAILYLAALDHAGANRHAEAVDHLQQAIALRKPAFEAEPWHWYRRLLLGADYKALADSHRAMNNPRDEVLALREYLRVISGPFWGAPIEPFLDPARPTDAEEARRLLALIEQAEKPGFRSYTVPANFSGIRSQMTVYVSNVPWPKNPLEDQARWLKEVNGGIIDPEAMTLFHNLQQKAHDQKASLIEVCAAAIGIGGRGKTSLLEDVGESPLANGARLDATAISAGNESPTKAADTALAGLQARVVELKTKLSSAPSLALGRETAAAIEELGRGRLRWKQAGEAVTLLREAARLRDQLARLEPLAPEPRQALAEVQTWLGKAEFANGNVDGASLAFHKRLDLLEQLQREHDEVARRPEVAQTLILLGELAEANENPPEALRWYAQAHARKEPLATARIANLVNAQKPLGLLLPSSIKPVFERVYDHEKLHALESAETNLHKELASQEELLESRRLETEALAARREAVVHEAESKPDAYREALTRELAIRKRQFILDPSNPAVVAASTEAASLLARSLVDAQKFDQAAPWLEHAAQLGHIASLFQLAEAYKTGRGVKVDPQRADLLRQFGDYGVGTTAFLEGRYSDALEAMKRVVASPLASPGDWNVLAQCYGKLNRWDEAVDAYTRSVEGQINARSADGVVVNLLEALVCANRPAQTLEFTESIRKKGWKLPPDDTDEGRQNRAIYHAYRAMALIMLGKDAAEDVAAIRRLTTRSDFKITTWGWDEFDRWFATTTLKPEARTAIASFVSELKGEKKPQPPLGSPPASAGTAARPPAP
ncbi:MAG: DUF2610 domain-containing protein [Isosphaeraceae bacterium]